MAGAWHPEQVIECTLQHVGVAYVERKPKFPDEGP